MLSEVEEGGQGSQSPPTEWQVWLFLNLKALVPVSPISVSLNWNLLRGNLHTSETHWSSHPQPKTWSAAPFLASCSPFFILVLQGRHPREGSWLQDPNTISLILSTTSHPILGTGPHISFSSSYCQARLFARPKGRLFNNCLSSPHPHALPLPARPAAGACIHPTLPGLAPQACKQWLHPGMGWEPPPPQSSTSGQGGVTHSTELPPPPAHTHTHTLSSQTRS